MKKTITRKKKNQAGSKKGGSMKKPKVDAALATLLGINRLPSRIAIDKNREGILARSLEITKRYREKAKKRST